ncbi:MAG: hypothetical protein AAF958_13590 [Planctomycetota bacterium]
MRLGILGTLTLALMLCTIGCGPSAGDSEVIDQEDAAQYNIPAGEMEQSQKEMTDAARSSN